MAAEMRELLPAAEDLRRRGVELFVWDTRCERVSQAVDPSVASGGGTVVGCTYPHHGEVNIIVTDGDFADVYERPRSAGTTIIVLTRGGTRARIRQDGRVIVL
jgi:hypothetical protein